MVASSESPTAQQNPQTASRVASVNGHTQNGSLSRHCHTLTIRINHKLKDRLSEIARDTGMSMVDVLNQALESHWQTDPTRKAQDELQALLEIYWGPEWGLKFVRAMAALRQEKHGVKP